MDGLSLLSRCGIRLSNNRNTNYQACQELFSARLLFALISSSTGLVLLDDADQQADVVAHDAACGGSVHSGDQAPGELLGGRGSAVSI